MERQSLRSSFFPIAGIAPDEERPRCYCTCSQGQPGSCSVAALVIWCWNVLSLQDRGNSPGTRGLVCVTQLSTGQVLHFRGPRMDISAHPSPPLASHYSAMYAFTSLLFTPYWPPSSTHQRPAQLCPQFSNPLHAVPTPSVSEAHFFHRVSLRFGSLLVLSRGDETGRKKAALLNLNISPAKLGVALHWF